MPRIQRADYWDSCVFLAYLNNEPGRVNVIEALLDELARSQGRRIITSALSEVEVTHIAQERAAGALDPDVEDRVYALLHHPLVVPVEVSQPVITGARHFIRRAVSQRLALKPVDAIHLATATWLKGEGITVDRFLTYDTRLMRFAEMAGLRIEEPSVEQLRLDLPGFPEVALD